MTKTVEEDGLEVVKPKDSKNSSPAAPDGGFGWFVSIGQFLIMGFYGGFLKSLTVFFIPLRSLLSFYLIFKKKFSNFYIL